VDAGTGAERANVMDNVGGWLGFYVEEMFDQYTQPGTSRTNLAQTPMFEMDGKYPDLRYRQYERESMYSIINVDIAESI